MSSRLKKLIYFIWMMALWLLVFMPVQYANIDRSQNDRFLTVQSERATAVAQTYTPAHLTFEAALEPLSTEAAATAQTNLGVVLTAQAQGTPPYITNQLTAGPGETPGPAAITATPSPFPTVEVQEFEAAWPTEMTLGESDSVRITLVYSEEDIVTSTPEAENHIVILVTPEPYGTPGLIQDAFPGHVALISADLAGAAFDIEAVSPTEFQLYDQSRLDFEWSVLPKQVGEQVFLLSVKVRWVSEEGREIPYQLFRERREVFVNSPAIAQRVPTRQSTAADLMEMVVAATPTAPPAPSAIAPGGNAPSLGMVGEALAQGAVGVSGTTDSPQGTPTQGLPAQEDEADPSGMNSNLMTALGTILAVGVVVWLARVAPDMIRVRTAMLPEVVHVPLPPEDGLSTDLQQRLSEVLRGSSYFGQGERFRDLFVNKTIAAWEHEVPTALTTAARVAALIRALRRPENKQGQNALGLFLRVMAEDVSDGTKLKQDLLDLADEVAEALDDPKRQPRDQA